MIRLKSSGAFKTPRRFGWFAVCVLIGGAISPGCHVLQRRHEHGGAGKPTRLPVVDVTGRVRQPQPVEIPENGLTVRQAVARAGGTDLDRPGIEYFAALRRGQGVAAQTTFVSLPLVMQGMASDIPLQEGDLLEITHVRQTSLWVETSLSTYGPTAGASAALQGLAQNPGVVRLGSESGLVSIQDVLDKRALRTESGYLAANVVSLSRISPTGIGRDTYILPAGYLAIPATSSDSPAPSPPETEGMPETSTPSAPNGTTTVEQPSRRGSPSGERPRGVNVNPNGTQVSSALNIHQMPIVGEDIVTLTQMERVPLILSGLVAPIAREKTDQTIESFRERRLRRQCEAQNPLAALTAPMRRVVDALPLPNLHSTATQ